MAATESNSKQEFSPHWHPPYDPPPSVVVGPCYVGPKSPYAWPDEELPCWLRNAAPSTKGARDILKALAIAFCAAVLGLSLPEYHELDFWIGMATFLVAMFVAVNL